MGQRKKKKYSTIQTTPDFKAALDKMKLPKESYEKFLRRRLF